MAIIQTLRQLPRADPAGIPRFRIARSLALIILAFFGYEAHASASPQTQASGFCRSLDGSRSLAIDRPVMVVPTRGIDTVRSLVTHLRQDLFVPISFVEANAVEPLTWGWRYQPPMSLLMARAIPLDELLAEVASQHPAYRCEIRKGRLILRDKSQRFDEVISGVQITKIYRMKALALYIDVLRTTKEFSTWDRPLIAGQLESPLFSEQVTLEPTAPLLDHLVQLLGELQPTYFTSLVATDFPRTIQIDMIPMSW